MIFFFHGRAACMWRDGSRISPFQANVNQASLMNCCMLFLIFFWKFIECECILKQLVFPLFISIDCARDMKIFLENRLNFPLACNGFGNYEPLQNINGHLFCIDEDGFSVTDYLNISSSQEEINCNQYLYNKHIPTQQKCNM